MKLLKKIILLFLSLITAFFALVIYFNTIRLVDVVQHERQIRALSNQEITPLDESAFMNFTESDELRLNEVQFIASHNSYKKNITRLGQLFVGLGENFDEARALRYHQPSLTTQLNRGVRSFELDMVYRYNRFELIHVPLVDQSSNAPLLHRAFDEMLLWSQNNPNHFPVIILIEAKEDFAFLDPFIKPYNDDILLEFNALIIDSFEDKLLTPNDLLIDNRPLKTLLDEDGWPLVNDLLGKFIIVMHPSAVNDSYLALDPSLKTLNAFVGNHTDEGFHTSFIVSNNPFETEKINGYIDQNLIVRTRLDSNLTLHDDALEAVTLSGAQIVSTDFFPSHSLNNPFVAYLENTFTIIKNPYFN
ncbi:MAG: Ca2+-dependent phosphoinositide-specific phospholipase C [Candidatus Izemoplasmataceae bacterium]